MRDYRAGWPRLTSETPVYPFWYLLLGAVRGKSRDGGAHGASKFWRGLPGVYCPIQNIFVVVDQLDYVSRAKSDAGFSCVGKQGGHRAQV